MLRVWCCLKEVSYRFQGSVKFQGHTVNKSSILTHIGRFRTVTPFEFTIGCKMIHKVGSSITRFPIVFSRSYVEFQGHMGQKTISILTQIGHFRTVTLFWIHWWLWNDGQSLKQHRRGALLFFKVIHQISRSHGTKNCRYWPELSVSGL